LRRRLQLVVVNVADRSDAGELILGEQPAHVHAAVTATDHTNRHGGARLETACGPGRNNQQAARRDAEKFTSVVVRHGTGLSMGYFRPIILRKSP